MSRVPEMLTIGTTEDGRMMAVITRGGHPQINPDETCHVLSVDIVATVEEAREWFQRMIVERPWEPRQ